jgi:predicted metal-dependent phosphoesterase TrpH
LIDLHLHTTASDGLLAPAALVARAAACGLRTISVTDHDTLAGVAEADAAADRHGLRLVSGVEVTALEDDRDVHMLAYFIDRSNPAFAAFLEAQRSDRLRRVREIVRRLAALGSPIDLEPLLALANGKPGRSIGRPQIADALVAAGRAVDRDDAFERFLGHGAPAFVPRSGPVPETVISVVCEAGGIVSLAHPGLTKMDHIIPRLAAAGLASLEVRHSDHDPATEERYRQTAAQYGLAISGGSDFHGDAGRRASLLGSVTISADEFAALERRRP